MIGNVLATGQFNSNVKGLLFATLEAVKDFDGGRGGVVVNTLMPPPANGSVYTTTKGAVDAITRSLAQELGSKGIRVIIVAPGVTVTEGFTSMPGHQGFILNTAVGNAGAAREAQFHCSVQLLRASPNG